MENKNKNKSKNEKDYIKYKKLNNFWRIKRGSNYNAYHRKNLGSIPSKFDSFIFRLPDESKSNLTSTLKPLMFQDENLCFRRDIFNLDHKSWNNFGSGNTIELKGNLLKFTVNNNIKNIKKNKSQYDLTNIEPFKTIYSNTNNSTVHSFISKDIINKVTDNKENKNDVGKLNKTKEDNNSETKFNKERNKYKSKSLMNKRLFWNKILYCNFKLHYFISHLN